MRQDRWISAGVLFLCLSSGLSAKVQYDRDVNIITTNYDLVDTTYIDRGRIDGVKVGDTYKVNFRDGKLATKVVVTGVFDRMASVKIVDSWLLKDGQLANFNQRSMLAGVDSKERRPAPDIKIGQKAADTAPGLAAAPAAAAPGAPDLGAPPAAPGAPDLGAAPAAPAAPDAGLPPAPDTGLPPAPDTGLPPAPDTGLPPAPDTGLPPAPDTGLPPAPDAGGAPPPPDGAAPPPPDPNAPPAPPDGAAPPPPDGTPPPPDDGGAPPPPPPPSF